MQAALAYIPLHPLQFYCTMQTAPLGGNLHQETLESMTAPQKVISAIYLLWKIHPAFLYSLELNYILRVHLLL